MRLDWNLFNFQPVMARNDGGERCGNLLKTLGLLPPIDIGVAMTYSRA